jgi:hypothetical protein
VIEVFDLTCGAQHFEVSRTDHAPGKGYVQSKPIQINAVEVFSGAILKLVLLANGVV